MAGRLTTHVLDTMHGSPASSMTLELWRIDPQSGIEALLKTVRTGTDGRPEEPLLSGDDFKIGVYEIVFEVGEYFSAQGLKIPSPPFLDRIPVRFGIADPSVHYHVPLLTSPWAYSTYRGG